MNKRREEYITNKLLIACTLTIIGVLTTFYISRACFMPKTALFFLNFLPIARTVIYTVFAVLGLKFAYDVFRKTDFDMKYFTSKTLFGIASVLFGCQVIEDIFNIYNSADTYIATFIVMTMIMYYMMLTYEKDMMIVTFANLANFSLLYLAGRYIYNTLSLTMYACSILGVVIMLILSAIVKKNDGKLFKIQVLNKKANYELINNTGYALLAITVISAIIAVLGLFPMNVGPIISVLYVAGSLFSSIYKKL